MMSNDSPTTFADDGRMRYFLGVANIHDIVNDIACVLLQCVVHRAVEGGTRAVIIDAQSTTNVEELHRMTHFCQLGKESRCLSYRTLNDPNIRNLRTDMEMH